MKTLTYMEIKNNFPGVLDIVKSGEEIVISTGKKRELLAVIIPYEKYQRKEQRSLGVLKGKAHYKIKDNFKITDEEIL
ncbi:MAG: type II toxin-antitoxin system prevent-host-death family antitoxin, partial [Candidatus Desantisbacteria bacterium]